MWKILEFSSSSLYLKLHILKCVGKISWPNVVSKFGAFYHKNRNAEFYQYQFPLPLGLGIKLLPAMTAFKEVM